MVDNARGKDDDKWRMGDMFALSGVARGDGCKCWASMLNLSGSDFPNSGDFGGVLPGCCNLLNVTVHTQCSSTIYEYTNDKLLSSHHISATLHKNRRLEASI